MLSDLEHKCLTCFFSTKGKTTTTTKNSNSIDSQKLLCSTSNLTPHTDPYALPQEAQP